MCHPHESFTANLGLLQLERSEKILATYRDQLAERSKLESQYQDAVSVSLLHRTQLHTRECFGGCSLGG